MKRAIYSSVIVAAIVALLAAAVYSQVRQPRVRATRQTLRPPDAPSQPGPIDPNMTPQQRFAQQQQDFQQRMAEMQRQMEQMQRQAEESRNNTIRQMLNATDEQWPRIKPKLDLIERLKAEANVAVDLGASTGMGGGGTFQSSGTGFAGGFMGGWMSGGGTMGPSGQPQTWSQYKTWGTPSARRGSGSPTDGEVLCDQLLRDLQTPGTPAAEIGPRIAALRKIRTQARDQLARARQDLRALIAPAQEPALVALGYLE
jgi:hypothetical protein